MHRSISLWRPHQPSTVRNKVKEDHRVPNDVITPIFRIETKQISFVDCIVLLVSVRDGIVSGLYRVFFDNVSS